jgi:predicted P-loop ATPase
MGFGGTLIIEQNERDRLIALKTQWIWEISEVEQIKKWGWDKAKDFLARPDDIYTPKNSNSAIVQARNWCLIGTTNSAELVTDPNAASRLPCFTISKTLDTDRVRAEAPAMWAGVKALMDAGMTSDLTEGLNQELTIRQRDHRGENPMRDQIEAYLDETRRTEVALPELARFVLNVTDQERFTKAMARELQMAMCDLGWIKKPGRAMVPCPFKGSPHKLKVTVYLQP